LNDGDTEVYYIENSDILFNEEYIIDEYDNKTNLVFFIPYQNINKAIRVQMNFSNKISNLGRKTSLNILLFYIIFVIITVTILLVLLNKFIVKRIIIMNDNINAIAESGDITKRLIVKDNNKDEISHLAFSFNNMLEQIEYLQQDLVCFATIDSLTKIYNGRVGLEKLETLMYAKNKIKQPLTICYMDVNNLKIVNDRLGHNIGNQLLIDVVQIIKQNIRNLDYLSRLGGDEFLLVLPNLTLLEASEVMKRINKKIESFNLLYERGYIISISFGIVEYDGAESLDELIIRADKKMYKHKTLIKKNTNKEVDMES
ncbi:MAG: sensor domain-containing diguanylate cyclase, partial [Bacillota bacterium]|nr:sensor domain-containing diguanylate cyclase [Bacillota bacterium]